MILHVCSSAWGILRNISQYSRYLNIFFGGRKANLDAADTLPSEPAPVPEKPVKPEDPPSALNRLLTMGISRGRHKDNQKLVLITIVI